MIAGIVTTYYAACVRGTAICKSPHLRKCNCSKMLMEKKRQPQKEVVVEGWGGGIKHLDNNSGGEKQTTSRNTGCCHGESALK